MRVVAWLIGAAVLFCGVTVYVKAPSELIVASAMEQVPQKAVLYIGDRQWPESWVDAYPEDAEELPEKLAGIEYRCIVVQPGDADCRNLLCLLQRTQPLARVILLGDEDLRPLAGEYRMEYRYYEKDGGQNGFGS